METGGKMIDYGKKREYGNQVNSKDDQINYKGLG